MKERSRNLFFRGLTFAIFLFSFIAFSEPTHSSLSAEETIRIQRLEMLADLWGKVYLFHPNIVRCDLSIDWNRALVETIPLVEKAGNTDELVSVLNESLLKALNDPWTYAEKIEVADESPREESPEKLTAKELSSAVGYIDASDPRLYLNANFLDDFQKAYKSLGLIKKLVVDLRWPKDTRLGRFPYYFLQFFLEKTLRGASTLHRLHHGWNETGGPSLYEQKWEISSGETFYTLQSDPYARRYYRTTQFDSLKPIKVPTLFIINNSSYLPLQQMLDALQSQPYCALAWEKKGRPLMPESLASTYLGSLRVYVRSNILVSNTNGLDLQPDFISEDKIGIDQLPALAETVFKDKDKSKKLLNPSFSFPMCLPQAMAAKDLLTREERLLGLFKIWNVLKYFFPQLEYADIEWPSMLREWIPRVEAAQSLRGYYLTLRSLASRLNDSHIGIAHRVVSSGEHTVGVKLDRVQGKVIVVKRIPDANGVYPPLQIGDEILEIEGRPLQEVEAYWKSQISSSTEQAFDRWLYQWDGALVGEKDSELKLFVKKEKGTEMVFLKRIFPVSAWFPAKDAPYFRALEGKIGYINLVSVPDTAALDKALAALSGSDGLILDIRGFPQFWVFDLISRLCNKPVSMGVFEIPVLYTPELQDRTWSKSQSFIEPDKNIFYDKPVVVLINAWTMSQSESFCMCLKDAARAAFVGSGTTGTTGNITFLNLPAGGRMQFTGMRALHADGRRFQNIGIVPDVEAKPTIEGIKEGKDEILEKGIETLKKIISSR